MYKNQLQELAQRSCFNLPSYACFREGPDHAPRFKVTVTFNGEIYESPTFFSTLRQAEHAAAEVALNTLANRGPSRILAAKVLDETGVYKNLLQETAHRAGLNLPVYTTVRFGPGHVPVFSCTIELAGMTFTGGPAKTKKQAQKNAAVAAWSALKQMTQQGSSSSSLVSSACQEELEQVVVARFLSSLSPAELSNSPQFTQQKGHHRSFITSRNSLSSNTSSFNTHYQNWVSSNPPPEMAMYYMWMQEQATEQQQRLMVVPVPIPGVPPPTLPWMHTMLQPSHHSYCLSGEQLPYITPEITSGTTSSSLCSSKPSVPNPLKVSSKVTIQELREEKQDDSSNLFPAEAPSAPVDGSGSSELMVDERLRRDNKQDSSLDAKIVTSAPPDIRETGSLVQTSARCANTGVWQEARFPTPIVGLNYTPVASFHADAGMALPTASRATHLRPTQKNFVTAPRMRSGVGSYSMGPRSGRTQVGGLHSPFMAPAVQIRSVVPVCSAVPPRRMMSSSQDIPPSDDVSNGSTGEISIASSKLENLRL